MNEDYVYTSDCAVGSLPNLYIVADGMGGHQAGDYASRYTVTRFVELASSAGQEEPVPLVDRILAQINREIRTIAGARPEYSGMGTTVVAASVWEKFLRVANVGDSRLYLYRGRTQTLTQITVDHSLVEEMVLAGGLNEQDARRHPDRNIITRAIGAEDRLRTDFFTAEIEEGDLVLLCTDGLTNMLEDTQIAAILRTADPIEEKAGALVTQANESGGRDNITVTIIDPFSPGRDTVMEEMHG